MALHIAALEAALNDFDPTVRANALAELQQALAQGQVTLPPERPVANMHCHTFFSFNAYGYSPTALAWLARKEGFRLIGMVDFDVLDGVDEFLNACDALGVRGSAGIETRVFVPEFATREINSPGEPGVLYHMGIGFTSSTVPPGARATLNDLQQRAGQRNRGLIERINPHLAPASIDYDADVQPLTPGSTPTERHIVVAYIRAAQRMGGDLAAFWADKLGAPREKIEPLLPDSAGLQNLVRATLMKSGGVGYIQPGPETFPAAETLNQLSVACGALPCAAWLDGFSDGEQAMDELLTLLIGQGVVTFNIIPDRNWNIPDAALRARKVQKLVEVVQLATELDLPLNIGTEMNSFGNKLVDDFDAPELAPVRQAFLDGAHFIYGHTALQRRAGMGYQSAWAQAALPTRRARNAFYTQAGALINPALADVPGLAPTLEPEAVLALLRSDAR